MGKRKTIPISIDEELLKQIDRELEEGSKSQAFNNRSKLIERCILHYIEKIQERRLQEYYQKYSEQERRLAKQALEAQRETLTNENWGAVHQKDCPK